MYISGKCSEIVLVVDGVSSRSASKNCSCAVFFLLPEQYAGMAVQLCKVRPCGVSALLSCANYVYAVQQIQLYHITLCACVVQSTLDIHPWPQLTMYIPEFYRQAAHNTEHVFV